MDVQPCCRHQCFSFSYSSMREQWCVALQAEYAVNTDAVQLRQVRVVAEKLSLVGTGAKLLHWCADKYGRPTSYSRVDHLANLIILNVDADC